MPAKPPVTPETKLPPLEADPVPLQDSTNPGYDVPPSPAIAEAPPRVMASPDARVHPAINQQPAKASPLEGMRHYQRNYADEIYQGELVNSDESVVDLMVSNVVALQMVVPNDPGWFREFVAGDSVKVGTRPIYANGEQVGEEDVYKSTGQLDYEAFMHEPVVIRIHSTKDKNEPWVVFCGVNGDNRWLPRNKNIRIPRKFVERLAAAQEMAIRSVEESDPSVDEAMRQVKSTAAAYEFSVLQDANPLGRRWLHRITRQGS